MTFIEAWVALFAKHWRTPKPPSAELPWSEREARRVGETPSERLKRISKLPR